MVYSLQFITLISFSEQVVQKNSFYLIKEKPYDKNQRLLIADLLI